MLSKRSLLSFVLLLTSKILHSSAFHQLTSSHHHFSISSQSRHELHSHNSQKDPDTNNGINKDMRNIKRIYTLSDLHTDNPQNMLWLRTYCTTNKNVNADSYESSRPGAEDALIIAGDISHELSLLKDSFEIIQDNLGCEIFFVPGNHEAWVGPLDKKGSLDKLDKVLSLCRDLGVRTEGTLLGTENDSPVWVVPLHGWYDGSLALPNCTDLCANFNKWPWTDFSRCEWPESYMQNNHDDGSDHRMPSPQLTQLFLDKNKAALTDFRDEANPNLNLITFSHFLPNVKALPDWKDVSSDQFLREEWLDHGQGTTSAKFAKVAGSYLIERQIRAFSEGIKDHTHIHVFGHSHRPKDFVWDDVRYIHHPLGKPMERELNFIDKSLGMKCIWDTTKTPGMVNGEQIIRYWDEKGGGKTALIQGLARRKKRRKIQMKYLLEKIDQKTN